MSIYDRLPPWARGHFARQAARIYTYQAVAAISGLLLSIVLARALGPEGKGTVDLVVLLSSVLVEFALLGIASGLLFQLATRKRPLFEIHGNALLVAAVIGSLGFVAALVLSAPVGAAMEGFGSGYAAVALAMTGFLVYSSVFTSLMIGIDRAPTANLVRAVAVALETAIALTFWAAGYLAVDTAVALLAGTWTTTALAELVITLRAHHGTRPRARMDSLLSSYGYGLRVFPGHIAQWLHYRIDQLVIAAFIGAGGVGIYAIGVRWAEMLWLVGAGLLNAGMYRIAASEDDASRRFTWRLFKATMVTTGLAGAAMMLLAGPLITWLYGEAFAEAAVSLVILVPGVVAWSGVRVLSRYIAFNRERPGLTTVIALAGAGLNLIGTLVLVPQVGIVGAAIATTISYSVGLAATFLAFRRLR